MDKTLAPAVAGWILKDAGIGIFSLQMKQVLKIIDDLASSPNTTRQFSHIKWRQDSLYCGFLRKQARQVLLSEMSLSFEEKCVIDLACICAALDPDSF